MERLAERWLELAFMPTSDPFDVPVIAVQGRGMERWLAQYCATSRGVFAGVRVTRVRGFVELVCDAVLRDDDAVRLDPSTLVFRIANHLDAVLATPDGAAFARYLEGADLERRMQLVERLAEVFDRYFVHRPKLVRAWGEGIVADEPIARAEAALLRAILRDSPDHEGRRIADAIARLDRATPLLTSGIPRKTFLFGVGTLAPLYLDLLRAVATVSDVHLFVLTPGETWLTDLGHDETARGEVGSIVRGFGKLAAEFQYLLEEAEGHVADYLGEIGELGDSKATVLATLKHDLCTLTQRGNGPGKEPPVVVSPDDRTFVVHACHSPQRELEVLHELIVDRLERDRTLKPSDFAVLATDVERYAPLIHAVFDRDRDARTKIPYHVADRGPRQTLGFVDAFFAILEALDVRASLPVVADLLDRTPIRLRFDLEHDDVEQAVALLRDAGARWGLDADDRTTEGQPGDVEFTFEHALDRLALGFALPSDADGFCGVVPSGMRGSSGFSALSGLFRFFDSFRALREARLADASVAGHVGFANRVLETLLDTGRRHDEEVSILRRALGVIGDRAAVSDFSGSISRPSFLRMIEAELDSDGAGGFLGGGITFCRQVPMRAIPFRVLCLLGLDDGSFPRNVDAPRFDLIAHAPERGDRSPRDDDRQAFLESILSARDELHLFHVGRDPATHSERAVSAVVGRTLEVVERSVVRADGGAVRSLVFVEHPLQGFDPAHFLPDAAARGLLGRDPRALARAKASVGPKSVVDASFVIGAADAPSTTIRLEELLRFVRRPSADFSTRVLGLPSDDEASALPEREVLALSGLDAAQVNERALALTMQGHDGDAIRTRLRREARLPPGAAGEIEATEAIDLACELLARHDGGAKRSDVAFELAFGEHRLVGTLVDLHEHGLTRVVASRSDAAKRLCLYVELLVLAAVAPVDVARRATFVSRPDPRTRSPEAVSVLALDGPPARDAVARLEVLVNAFIASSAEPQTIDAELLEAYVRAIAKSEGTEDAALSAAAAKFVPESRRGSFGEPRARARLFRAALVPGGADRTKSLLGRTFVEVAEKVYAPLDEGASES